MAVGHIRSALVLGLLGVVGNATPGHALAICVQSKELAVQQSECIRRGSVVIDKYFEQSQHDTAAVFGFQGNATAAAILCDQAAKNVVFFAVSSTDEDVCRRDIQKLMNEF
jgi:hypothetical protein